MTPQQAARYLQVEFIIINEASFEEFDPK